MTTALSRVHSRISRAKQWGFHASVIPEARFRAKPGSHDDGPDHGLFLGPLGGPAFSRDLTGRFSRWHLEPGMHVVTDIDAAFFTIHWSDREGNHYARLRREDVRDHDVATLHPLSHETFALRQAPFTVHLTAFSPAVPGDEDLAGLPVVIFDIDIEPEPGTSALPELDVAAFWPNLNGWHASRVTSSHRGDIAWPGHHHAGNVNRPATPPCGGEGVIQSRIPAVAGPQSMCGDVALTVAGDADQFSRQVQFKLDPNATGLPPSEQPYTMDTVLDAFHLFGRLGVTPDDSWQAHWHEPIGSAVAARAAAGRTSLHTRFVIAFDWPVVHFGQGRQWFRRYASSDLPRDQRALAIADLAHRQADQWLTQIDSFHDATLDRFADVGWPARIAGCAINELNLTTSLGSAWVRGNPDGHRAQTSPCAGPEHLGVLEGFDTGYYYYNTSDLWHYAFPALTLTWPRLADLVFDDLAAALDAEIPDKRPVYRPAARRPLLVARKLPHDLGCPAEDPFIRINGYAMRDDPNTWRDSNPAFVLATLLHHRLLRRPLGDVGWRRLAAASEVTAEQTEGNTGVPRHDEFGDSTWDNLGLRGYSTYTAGLCTGMWAVLAQEATNRGLDATPYTSRLHAAQATLDQLWNGGFYQAASEGKYVNAVMGDSLMGLFYADLCGVPGLAPADKISSHLRSAYTLAHRQYHQGSVGPLLIAEEGIARYERDGGQELQVNEVLLGSAWLFTAMLAHYGLPDEAREIADSLRTVLYGRTGLQFRTPAAVDAEGAFRAPLNMRPLAIWWLPVIDTASPHPPSAQDR